MVDPALMERTADALLAVIVEQDMPLDKVRAGEREGTGGGGHVAGMFSFAGWMRLRQTCPILISEEGCFL